jgi:hypothetical protein
MKQLIVILISLASLNTFAQDTLRIPQSEIDDIISVMDTLIEQDSINNVLIEQQKEQIANYELLTKQDSMLLSFKSVQINLYKEQTKLYEQKLRLSDKWWNKRPFGYILGVASTILLIHTIDYALPR